MVGLKKSIAEIAELKVKIMEYIAAGLQKRDIKKLMGEKYGVKERTFNRYWASLMVEEEKRIFEEKKSIFVGFVRRSLNRIREAHLRYEDTKKREWLMSSHIFEKDFFEKMQSIGLLEKAPELMKGEITLVTYGKPEWLKDEKEKDANKNSGTTETPQKTI